jgi:single-stranded-DNA-specific exonuclease
VQWVATVLVGRGLDSAEAVRAHFEADLRTLPSPSALADCTRAAERLRRAVAAGERITVYGDYDVDGVTSTAVLCGFFREVFDLELHVFIPHRVRDGYGLNVSAVERLAREGTRVLVTVDNGSSAVAEVELAQSLGLDVIIVDHHQVSDPEPPAYAHLNPRRPVCTFPDKGLAAVGVAFMLVVELRRQLRDAGHFNGRSVPRIDRWLDIVALGTVADVAPLTGLNRVLVRHGLEVARAQPRPGFLALCETARVTPEALSARDLGYKFGPRVNAAGRMDDATRGLELLRADNLDTARRIASGVEAQNLERRVIEQRMTEEAITRVESESALSDAAALVLEGDTWHPGVVGIVAARMVERYGRPSVLLAPDACGWKGSVRSVPGVDVKRALDRCAQHLLRHGGHAAAAGVSLRVDALAAFRSAFAEAIASAAGDALVLHRGPDAEASLAAITGEATEQLARLGPFGEANPAPVLLVRGVRGHVKRLDGGHVKVALPPADLPREMLAWRIGERADLFDAAVDVLVTPEIEVWRGRRSLVLRVVEVRASGAPEA